MNLQKKLNEIQLVQEPTLCKGINQFNGISWDELENKFIYSTFQILLKDQEIQYIKEGSIIRQDIIKDNSNQSEYLTNLEQIKFLKWIGSYDKNNQQIGKWIVTWKGETLQEIGGYYDEGKKQSLWKEQFKNYWNQAQVYEFGEYLNDQRQGNWKYIYKGKEIAGGTYNQAGQKHGKWMQPNDSFWDLSQIIHFGEYYNGKKIGIWDIWFDEYGINNWIGGGLYDEKGQELKVGNWIEISNRFWFHSCLTYNGEYKKGKKIGFWKSFWNEGSQIGGGLYDEGGKELKIGNWIDVSDGFSNRSVITFDGEYNNGLKVGKWATLFNLDGNNKQIGGGEYDELHGVKLEIGLIQVKDFINFHKQLLMGNIKMVRNGGGLYDEGNQEAKIGNWIEISSEFSDWSQVTFEGKYKNGQKFGGWFRNCNVQEQKLIGGGSYDEGDQALKVGNWIEISDGFKSETQVTYRGEYQNGIKIGKWEIWARNNFDNQNIENIGGGQYDQGEKVGIQIEISDGFLYLSEIFYNGIYKNGKKIGIWEEQDVDNKEKVNEINYDH